MKTGTDVNELDAMRELMRQISKLAAENKRQSAFIAAFDLWLAAFEIQSKADVSSITKDIAYDVGYEAGVIAVRQRFEAMRAEYLGEVE